MFEITKPSANRVDIAITGQIDADDMARALDDLIAKSEDIREGRMLYTLADFSLPTIGALGVEMSRLPKLFGILGKFSKCAVLSDQSWLRKAAEIEGAVLPGLEIKAFEMGDAAAAEAWLAGDA